MSSQIRKERTAYYQMLEETQAGSMDISSWMRWFLGCLERALEGADQTLDVVFARTRLWNHALAFPLNERQRSMLARLADDFKGKLTTSKWARMAKCSQDTALRDITELMEWGILLRNPGGGRNTSYGLADIGASDEAARDWDVT